MGKALTIFVLIVLAIVAGFSVLLHYLFGPIATMMVWFVLISLFMILVVLIQKPKGGGLSGAFGGAGSGSANDMLGAKAGDVLTWFTIGAFICFLSMSIALTLTMLPENANAAVPGAAAPAAPVAPAGPGDATAEEDPAGPAGDPVVEDGEMTVPSPIVEPQPAPTGDPLAEPAAPIEPAEPVVPEADVEAPEAATPPADAE